MNFQGSRPVLLRNPNYMFLMFQGWVGPGPPVPLWIRPCVAYEGQMWYLIVSIPYLCPICYFGSLSGRGNRWAIATIHQASVKIQSGHCQCKHPEKVRKKVKKKHIQKMCRKSHWNLQAYFIFSYK